MNPAVKAFHGRAKPGSVALAAALMWCGLAGCGGDGEQSAGDGETTSVQSPDTSAPPSSPASPFASSTQEEGRSAAEGPAADVPLSKNLEAEAQSPMWAFPVLVTGWTQSTLDQGGVNQLEKDRSESTFTSYQLMQGTAGGADEANSKAYLASFAADLGRNTQVRRISTPRVGTTTISSDRGSLEFVQQDLTYTTADGTTYRSRYLARSVDTYVLALQYAGPVTDWSEKEWVMLLGSGLSAVLGV